MKHNKSVVSFIVVLAMVLTMCTPVWAHDYLPAETGIAGLAFSTNEASANSAFISPSAVDLDGVASNSAIVSLSALSVTSGDHTLNISPVFTNAGTPIVLSGGNLTTTADYEYYEIADDNSTLVISTGAVAYTVTGSAYGSLAIDAAGSTVNAIGTFGDITVTNGALYVSGTAANLTVDGGTVFATGTFGRVTVNDGTLWLGYTDADVPGTQTSVTDGIDANGGTTCVANTSINRTSLAMNENQGIINIYSGAVLTLTEGAVVSRNEKTSTGTVVGVLTKTDGTLNINGGTIDLRSSGDVVNDVALIGIKSLGTANISSGSVTLVNGAFGANIGIINNQGELVLGDDNDTKDPVTISVAGSGIGIKTFNTPATTTIYDATINISAAGGYEGYGIHSDGDTVLRIIAGPETVEDTVPDNTVAVNAAGGTALHVGSSVKWSIAGGYNTAVFSGETALEAPANGLTPDLPDHAVNEAGKPLNAGHFIGSAADMTNLIPAQNYYVCNYIDGTGTHNVVIDLTWEAQNALQTANINDVVTTAHTSINGQTVTYTLEDDITYGAVKDDFHGRVNTTTVSIRTGRSLEEGAYKIYDIDNNNASSSAMLGDATYYYSSTGDYAVAHSEFNETFGTGAYVRFVTAPSDSAIKGSLDDLVSRANNNNRPIAEVVVFKGTHSLATRPDGDKTIYVSPSAADADARLDITGLTGPRSFAVRGEGVYAASAAALVVSDSNASVTVSGVFDSLSVEDGTVYIDGGVYEALTVSGGKVYISSGAVIGDLNITGGVVYECASTIGAVRVTNADLWLGYSDYDVASDAAGSAVSGGIVADGNNAVVHVYNTSLTSEATSNETAQTSVVYINNGATVYLSSGAAVTKTNNLAIDTTGYMYGVYNYGGTLYMTTGSSITLKRDTVNTSLEMTGVSNAISGSTAYISGGSISLTNGSDKSKGIQNLGTLFLGNKDGVKDDVSIRLGSGGYGVYTGNSGAQTTIYDIDIYITGNSNVDAYGIYSTDASYLTVKAGPVTVDSTVPTSTVAVSVDTTITKGYALWIGSKVVWDVEGGYETAVFEAVNALCTQTNAKDPVNLTAGRYVGKIFISETAGSLNDLIPDPNYAINGTPDVDQTIIDLTWQLRNAMEQDPSVEFTQVIYPSGTAQLYTSGTETLVGDVDYNRAVFDGLHGRIDYSSIAAVQARNLKLNGMSIVGEDGVDLFFITADVNISGAGLIRTSNANTIDLSGSAVTLSISDNAAVEALVSGNAITKNSGTLNVSTSTVRAIDGDAVYTSEGATTISSSVISTVTGNAIEMNGGTLDITASTVSAVNFEALLMHGGAVSISASALSSQNGDAACMKGGTLDVYSGEFTTTSGDAIHKTGGTLTVTDGSFKSAEGFGLDIAGGYLNTMLYGGTFSSVTNGAVDHTSLAAMLPYENGVPAYTFKAGNNAADVYLSSHDLARRSSIASGAAADGFAVNIAAGNLFESDFTVVPRVYYDIYCTSDDYTTVSAVQGPVSSGSTDTNTTIGALVDIDIIHFRPTDGALVLSFEAADGYLLKELAFVTMPGFIADGRTFAYENHYGSVNSTGASIDEVSGAALKCDYALKAISSEKTAVSVSRSAVYTHGSASYEYLFDAAGAAVTQYAISAPASAELFTTDDAITSASIDIAAGNKLQLTFTPYAGHAIHSLVTDGAVLNVISGIVETINTPYAAWAAVTTDSSIDIEFCDKTNPAALTPGAASYAAVNVQKGATWTLTAPVVEAPDSHYQLVATAGSWTVSDPAYVTLGAVSGASITLSAIADTSTPVAVTFTAVVAGAGTVVPASVTWSYTVTSSSGGGGGAGGGGGGAAAPASSYDVTVKADGVTSDKDKASAGDTITITVPAGSTDVKVTDANGKEISLTKISDTQYSFKMPSSKVSVSYASDSPKAGFVDVDENDYYYDAVNWAVANGITTGTDAEHFSPDAVTDRAQAVTFLWRAAGCPEPTTTDNPFTDIDSGKYYYKAVLWAVEQGITNGIEPGEFGPEVYLTRAHIVTFLYRFAKPSGTFSNGFVDLKDGDFYIDAVSWANENGIATGLDATHFGPENMSVRADTITFLYRFFK